MPRTRKFGVGRRRKTHVSRRRLAMKGGGKLDRLPVGPGSRNADGNPMPASLLRPSAAAGGAGAAISTAAVGGAGAGSYLLSKLLASGVSPSLLHLYQEDWLPSGVLEEELLYDSERIVSSIMNWMLPSGK